MFLRGACPIHNPLTCPEPGKLYWDARWPSDQYALQDPDGNGFSIAFIPGRLSDHNLLDDKYVYRLRMMSGSLSAAMEQGCWCELQGAYFANWNASRMVIPYATVGAEWWDAHFLSLDYGFGKSSASAHLHVRTQDGKIKTVGEFVAPHLPAYEFAGEVVRRLVAPITQGQRRKILAVYLDPSNFKNIGDGHTIADQINEVLEPYDLGVIPASNDRIGGWGVRTCSIILTSTASGGLSPDGTQWIHPRYPFFLPVRVLSRRLYMQIPQVLRGYVFAA